MPPQAYKLDANVAGNALDVLANFNIGTTTDAVTSYRRLRPGLTLKADPGRLRKGERTEVRFTVLDAGDSVSGARVKVAGRSGATDAEGRVTLSLRSRRGVRAVTHSGYTAATRRIGSTRLSVRPPGIPGRHACPRRKDERDLTRRGRPGAGGDRRHGLGSGPRRAIPSPGAAAAVPWRRRQRGARLVPGRRDDRPAPTRPPLPSASDAAVSRRLARAVLARAEPEQTEKLHWDAPLGLGTVGTALGAAKILRELRALIARDRGDGLLRLRSAPRGDRRVDRRAGLSRRTRDALPRARTRRGS